MLYLIFLLIDLSLSLKPTPDALVIKKADIELNHLILKKNSTLAADFYSNDFILTTPSGKARYKQDIIDEIASPEVSLIVNETSDVEVRIAGSTAVLTGTLHQKGSYRGKFFDHWFVVTDTWTETPTGWKILSGHASRQPSRIKT
jgi:ketosteroid isomerase-like protein